MWCGYSEVILVNVLWKCYVELLRDYFGEQGSVWRACCERATLGYSEITLVNVLWTLGYSGISLVNMLWKCCVELLRDHFGECAMEELLWATQGLLWRVWCGRAKLG